MAKADPSTPHIEAARRRLVHLHGIAGRTAATEARTEAAARERLEAVGADLDSLRPRVNTDPDAASRYQALVLERGQLQRIVTQAQQVQK